MASPNTSPDFYGVDEDDILRINLANGVLDNDSDPDGDSLAARIGGSIGFPHNPLFDFKTNGSFVYDARYHEELKVNGSGELDPAGATTLAEGFNSLAAGATITDTYTYIVTDGVDETEETVTITITGVNDDPEAEDDSGVFDQATDAQIDIDVLGNDTDVDTYGVGGGPGDVLSIVAISDNADDGGPAGGSDNTPGDGLNIVTDAGGTVTLVGGQLRYEAAAGFFGVDTFDYTADDGNGGTSTATVRVTVLPDNEAPDAVDDVYTISEGAGATVIGNQDGDPADGADPADNDDDPVLANDTDADDAPLIGAELIGDLNTALTRTGGGDPGLLLDFNADGTFEYDPNGAFESLGAGETATVTFQYKAFDGKGLEDTATVTITIVGENDLPGAPPAENRTVYEAGLADGSGDGPTTITHTIDFTLGPDPDGDPLRLVDVNGDGATETATISGTYGTLTFVDDDTVSYTLNATAEHADGNGHNSTAPDLSDVIDAFDLYVDDGSGDFLSVQTGVNITVVDDITLLNQAPDEAVGGASADDLDDGTVAFTAGAMQSDTFTFIEGADDATLEFTGIPNSFQLIDGRTVTSTVSADGLSVLGTTPDGDDADTDPDPFYTLELIEGTAGDGEWTHKITVHQSPPVVVNPIDFSTVKAGGPKEVLTVENIDFTAGFFTVDGTPTPQDIVDSFNDLGAASSADDVNPNNAGGIGIGDGNIQESEVLVIDVRDSLASISGLSFILKGNGGGVADDPDVYWVAVLCNPDGSVASIVASGIEETTNINASKTFDLDGDGRFETGGEEVFVEPGVAFDKIFVAMDPEDIDTNDTVRINRVATIEEQESPDIILPFGLRANEDIDDGLDGDVTQEEFFEWTIDGLSTDPAIEPGLNDLLL